MAKFRWKRGGRGAGTAKDFRHAEIGGHYLHVNITKLGKEYAVSGGAARVHGTLLGESFGGFYRKHKSRKSAEEYARSKQLKLTEHILSINNPDRFAKHRRRSVTQQIRSAQNLILKPMELRKVKPKKKK